MLRDELQIVEQPVWEAILGASLFTTILLSFGYGVYKLGKYMLRDALSPTNPAYTIASWLVLLAGVGLMVAGVASWRQGDLKTGATALSGGFTVAAVGFSMVKSHCSVS